MNQHERKDGFQAEDIRSRLTAGNLPAEPASSSEPTELNDFARQIALQYRAENRSPNIVLGQLRLLDAVALFAIGLTIAFFNLPAIELTSIYNLVTLGSGAAIAIFLFQIADCYQIPMLRAPVKALPRLLTAWLITFALLTAGLFLLKAGDTISRSLVLSWIVAGGAYLVIARIVAAYGIRHWARDGTMERRAVIVGGGQPAKDLIRSLEHQPENDIRICGIFDDRGSARSPEIVAGYPKLGSVNELVEFARLTRIDMLIIALPLSAEARIMQLLRKLWVLPLDIRLAAHSNKLRFRPRAYSHVGAVAMLDIFDKPIRDWDSVAKRCFDVLFSVVALVLLWPVMLGAAIAVKATSKGPVFFVQKRHGFNNEVIRVLKFRSMYTNQADITAKQAVTKNDPRVTPVGRFLRKSSIDELPQLFNVLRGELSLVGPRPHAIEAQTRDLRYGDVVEGYFARHRVKPGVTGWAQINGWRGEIDSQEKIRQRTAFDLYYIENWSLFFDLKILFLTPIRLLNTENAY